MIDLRLCSPGDILISKHWEVLTYVEYNPCRFRVSLNYPHIVKYQDGSFGSRIDTGHVYRNNRLPEDHDICAVFHLNGKVQVCPPS